MAERKTKEDQQKEVLDMPEKIRKSKHNKQKEVSSERKVLFGMSVALVVTIFITGCLIGIILTRDTAAAEPIPQVKIDCVDLVKTPTMNTDDTNLYVDVHIDITNIGDYKVDSVLVRLTVEETDSTLALSMNKETIKDLTEQTTQTVIIPIVLPKENNRYNIKLKLYVNNMLMVRGQSQVVLGQEEKVTGHSYTTTEDRSQGDDDEKEEENWDLMAPEDSEDAAASSVAVGFIGLIFVAVIIVISIIIVLAIRSAKKATEENNEENSSNGNGSRY
jgi:flagellar basal body-associated protein FliL